MIRKPMKRSGGILKRGGPIRKKSKSPLEKKEQQDQYEKMWELFNLHWSIRPHVCESCDLKLWGENKSIYHHHLLEKSVGKYKHLIYNIDNLMLLCGDCHTRVTNGYPSDKVKERTEKAKEELMNN